MDFLRGLTREQRQLAAAGALVLFIISMFLNWKAGAFTGRDIIPSWWILLILAILGIGGLLSDTLRIALPGRLKPAGTAAFASAVCLIESVQWLFASGSTSYGLVLAVIFSVVATVLSVVLWREEG